MNERKQTSEYMSMQIKHFSTCVLPGKVHRVVGVDWNLKCGVQHQSDWKCLWIANDSWKRNKYNSTGMTE